jgi:hypothetical protein
MRASSVVLVALLMLGACSRGVVVVRPGGPPGPAARTLGVPPGHWPRPGQCRVWIPGTPPGRQARARSCSGILAAAPAGAWILYRPASGGVLHVRVVHESRPGVLVRVRVFNLESAELVDERAPGPEDDEPAERGRGRRGRP